MLWRRPYSEFVFTETLWPDFGAADLQGGPGRVRCRGSAVRRPMRPFWSRIVVSLVLLPVISGIVWLGGWWLFAAALWAG
jgi:hypothetical protein